MRYNTIELVWLHVYVKEQSRRMAKWHARNPEEVIGAIIACMRVCICWVLLCREKQLKTPECRLRLKCLWKWSELQKVLRSPHLVTHVHTHTHTIISINYNITEENLSGMLCRWLKCGLSRPVSHLFMFASRSLRAIFRAKNARARSMCDKRVQIDSCDCESNGAMQRSSFNRQVCVCSRLWKHHK